MLTFPLELMMSILSADMNDVINMADRAIMEEIAKTDDHPVLMINQNLYTDKANFPNDELDKKWRAINQKMIKFVDAKILWSIPVKGQIMHNGNGQPLSEILAYWYPSHQAFLDMKDAPDLEENFTIRKEIIEYAIIHRCDGRNSPMLPSA